MAGPFELAFRNFSATTIEKYDRIVFSVVFQLAEEIIVNWPVDTGYSRANWQYGLDAPPAGTLANPPGQWSSQKKAPPPRVQVEAKAGGHVHYLANNASYAWSLEHGHSQQAPAGVVRLAVAKFQQMVDEAAAREFAGVATAYQSSLRGVGANLSVFGEG